MLDEHPNAAVKDCFAINIIWHLPGRNPLSGDHHGPDDILGFLGKLRQLSGGTLRTQLTSVLANDDYGVALHNETGRRGDKQLDMTGCQVMRIREGKIVEVRGYYFDQYALDEFWS